MRHIAIVGNSGSGKSTLAEQLATKLGLTHIELDALFHQPNWTPSLPSEFQSNLLAAMADADRSCNGWVTCGNYRTAGGRINQTAADTIVWLDMPRSVIMRRIIGRSFRRALTREILWNGNREPLTNLFKMNPNDNIIRWAWVKFDDYRRQNMAAIADGTWSHATVHHLRSSAEVAAFVQGAS